MSISGYGIEQLRNQAIWWALIEHVPALYWYLIGGKCLPPPAADAVSS